MNKQKFNYLILLFLLFLIEVACRKVFSGHLYLIPQFTLLFVMIFATREPFVETLWFAFLAGFFLEWFSGLFFSADIVGLALTGVAAYLLTRKLTSQQTNLFTAIFLVILGTLFFPLFVYLYLIFASSLGLTAAPAFTDLLSTRLIWTALSNSLFFYPIRFIFYARPFSAEK